MDDRKTKIMNRQECKRQTVMKRIGTADLRQPPDFLIIGAQKGGTTSLFHYLGAHPDVGAAFTKEVHYFDRHFGEGMAWYLAHFPLRGSFPVVGEASPYYLFHPEAPRRVWQTVPMVKLIALLRNPVDRAYSNYQMNVKMGIEHLSFEEAIDQESERLRQNDCDAVNRNWRRYSYVRRGLYAEQLRRWLGCFPREQMLVLNSEEFFQRPDLGYERTLAFLGLRPWRLSSYENCKPGTYTGIQPETRARLADFYAAHNQQLYGLLGEDYGWDVA